MRCRGCGKRRLRRLRYHQPSVERAVAGRRQVPAVGLGHRAGAHRVEAVFGAIGVERTPDAAQEGLRRRLREQEAGLAVGDGFRKPAGLVTDRERTEALRVHLAEAAGLEARRHQG
ncbi:hypothetical protein chiPu_0027665, partial [Chiloscyllium punctatum]|nr:hypothetical protein [Chiloscyllium punctatum]